MQQRVVFLCYHAFGHVNACLKLANIIREHGHEVIFAGVGFFETYVLQQGFRYYVLEAYPFGLGLETWKNTIEKKKYIYFSELGDRINDTLAKKRQTDLYWMLESLKPNIVLLDSFQATDFILLYHQLQQRKIKLAIIHPTLPTTIDRNYPPINHYLFPNDVSAVQRAVLKIQWQQFIKRAKNKAKNIGYGDAFLIARRTKRNQIPARYIDKKQNLLNCAVSGVAEFILLPQEFNFPGIPIRDSQKYVGFQLEEKRRHQINLVYDARVVEIYKLKNKNSKVVYCSFGTIELKNKKIVLPFLERLIHLAKTENFVLVISLQAQPEDIAELQRSEMIYVFQSVPQLEVLSYADVFVTHGGINSIKEAVYAEVPMLMVPVHSDYDPKGNSARVVYHGLGLYSDAGKDSALELKNKISDLMHNPLYKKRLKEMRMKDEVYTGDKFLEYLNALKLLDDN